MRWAVLSFPLLGVLGLAGCTSTGGSGERPAEGRQSDPRYQLKQDRGPAQPIDVSLVADAVPRWEPPSRAGNKTPYQVWGKTYHVLANSEGYRERGVASWYGKKFHGHQTANGEVYDMYGMSAAHKSLPLPSYARVTNVANNRSVVVRVNDRGPFHDSRLIDLSYAAAARLDMLRQGTATVIVEALDPKRYVPSTEQARAATGGAPLPEPLAQPKRYLQVGAYSRVESARLVQQRLERLSDGLSVDIEEADGERKLYRVRMGPVADDYPLEALYGRLKAAGFAAPLPVDLP